MTGQAVAPVTGAPPANGNGNGSRISFSLNTDAPAAPAVPTATAPQPLQRPQTTAPLPVVAGPVAPGPAIAPLPAIRPVQRRRLMVAFGVLLLVALLALVFGFRNWERAVNAEAALGAANGRIAEQERIMSDLNAQVSRLNADIDDVSTDLDRAQGAVASTNARADELATASAEISQANDLMGGAIESLSLLVTAIGDKDLYNAEIYGSRAGDQIRRARTHLATASSALSG